MPKNYFIPSVDGAKELWLKNFSNKLNTYAAKYGINGLEVADMVASSLHFTYWLNHRQQFEDYVKKITAYKNESRDGIGANAAIPTTVPTLPAVGGMPASVAPGIFARAASLAARIKNHKDYLESEGQDMGLIGSEHSIDVLTLKPDISLRLVAGGHPEIVWSKNRMEALEIYVDRGTGYSMLAQVSHPNTIDHAPLPAIGQSTTWRYRAIYRHHDDQLGLWSDEVSITVTGNM